jgi:hypothetical protein
VSFVDDALFVVRSTPGATASLVFNFSDGSLEHPAPDPADAVVFDSDDPRWGSGEVGAADPATIPPWSARLSIT